MSLQRFGWWFVWGTASAAFLMIVLKGGGRGAAGNLLIVAGMGLASGAASLFFKDRR